MVSVGSVELQVGLDRQQLESDLRQLQNIGSTLQPIAIQTIFIPPDVSGIETNISGIEIETPEIPLPDIPDIPILEAPEIEQPVIPAPNTSLLESAIQGVFQGVGQSAFSALQSGVSGVSRALTSGISEAAEYTRIYGALDNAIAQTGGTLGLTIDEIQQFASDLGNATLTSEEAVLEAARALTSFRNITDDTFTRAITVAQDLSEVMGSDLNSNIIQVAKALEDPVRGVTALARAGTQFSDSQREVINSLVESGDVLAAQNLILSELETQYGGAGIAAAQGLTGALDTLGEEVNDVNRAFGLAVENSLTQSVTDLGNVVENLDLAGFASDIGGLTGSGIEIFANSIKLAAQNADILLPVSLALVAALNQKAIAAGAAAVQTQFLAAQQAIANGSAATLAKSIAASAVQLGAFAAAGASIGLVATAFRSIREEADQARAIVDSLNESIRDIDTAEIQGSIESGDTDGFASGVEEIVERNRQELEDGLNLFERGLQAATDSFAGRAVQGLVSTNESASLLESRFANASIEFANVADGANELINRFAEVESAGLEALSTEQVEAYSNALRQLEDQLSGQATFSVVDETARQQLLGLLDDAQATIDEFNQEVNITPQVETGVEQTNIEVDPNVDVQIDPEQVRREAEQAAQEAQRIAVEAAKAQFEPILAQIDVQAQSVGAEQSLLSAEQAASESIANVERERLETQLAAAALTESENDDFAIREQLINQAAVALERQQQFQREQLALSQELARLDIQRAEQQARLALAVAQAEGATESQLAPLREIIALEERRAEIQGQIEGFENQAQENNAIASAEQIQQDRLALEGDIQSSLESQDEEMQNQADSAGELKRISEQILAIEQQRVQAIQDAVFAQSNFDPAAIQGDVDNALNNLAIATEFSLIDDDEAQSLRSSIEQAAGLLQSGASDRDIVQALLDADAAGNEQFADIVEQLGRGDLVELAGLEGGLQEELDGLGESLAGGIDNSSAIKDLQGNVANLAQGGLSMDGGVSLNQEAMSLDNIKLDNSGVESKLDTLNNNIASLANTPRSLNVSTPDPIGDSGRILSNLASQKLSSANL
jgi:hypothetical protein